MQGRLLPPVSQRFQAFPAVGWEREFPLAQVAGVDGIEWIYEVQGEAENPVGSDAGLSRMASLGAKYGIRVESLCADWFMDRPLLGNVEAGVEKLRWLLGRARAGGIRRVVLPFVDASSLQGDAGVDALVFVVAELLPGLTVELQLETDLGPDEFADLLRRLDHPLVKANYDIGNSASLGYDPRAELVAYGERVGSVHVKDRVRGGGTVPVGTGSADLELVFSLLHERGWSRPLVLQVARGADGDEVDTVRSAAEHVRRVWARTGSRSWS